MSLEEIDDLFYLLENPTRRRILQLLSRERLYPLQLSREIDVSQQAVVKHLRILEEHGMVASRDEPSDRGPNRRVYRASRSVSLHIDVGPTTFREQAAPMAEDAELSTEQLRIRSAISEARSMEPSARMDLLARVGEDLRHSLRDHEQERQQLLALIGELNREVGRCSRKADCSYDERRLLHHMLQNPNYTIEGAAVALGLREAEVRLLLAGLEQHGLAR